MALDATRPTDTDPVSIHAEYIRAARAAINTINNVAFSTQELEIALGTVALEVGVDLSNGNLEMIFLTAAGVVTIGKITEGREGQIKIFMALDSQVIFTHNAVATTGGVFRLNQPAFAASFTFSTGDVLVLVNKDGADGYWRELWRTLYVG